MQACARGRPTSETGREIGKGHVFAAAAVAYVTTGIRSMADHMQKLVGNQNTRKKNV